MTKLTQYFNYPNLIASKITLYVFLFINKYRNNNLNLTNENLFLLNKKTPYITVRSFIYNLDLKIKFFTIF